MLMKKPIITLTLAATLIVLSFFYLFPFWKNGNEKSLASDFIFTDINGVKRRLSDFKGKVVLIDFMATWCYPCKSQVNILREVWLRYRDGGKVVFLTISVDPKESLKLLADYARQNGLDWIVGLSSEAGVKYDVKAIPTIVIVDEDGRVVLRNVGVVSADRLINVIDREIEG